MPHIRNLICCFVLYAVFYHGTTGDWVGFLDRQVQVTGDLLIARLIPLSDDRGSQRMPLIHILQPLALLEITWHMTKTH